MHGNMNIKYTTHVRKIIFLKMNPRVQNM